jgi:hypothetical protein
MRDFHALCVFLTHPENPGKVPVSTDLKPHSPPALLQSFPLFAYLAVIIA